jgi:hypothetical protein
VVDSELFGEFRPSGHGADPAAAEQLLAQMRRYLLGDRQNGQICHAENLTIQGSSVERKTAMKRWTRRRIAGFLGAPLFRRSAI